LKFKFQLHLLKWYHRHRRDLPWRKTRDPYAILLSEVMLQQTQVVTVLPYYHRFLKAFPTFKALAKAPLGRVLKLWEGLGYYSRARNLQKLAKEVTNNHRGKLPSTYDALLALPGIGRYTAGAVLSIAFDQRFPIIDGNVQRVFARYFGVATDLRAPATQKKMWELAASLLPKKEPGHYNQALMELGALICVPQNPKCLICPVAPGCVARREGRQDALPFKSKKSPIPHKQIGAGVIWKDDRILISQRPLEGLLGGLWEFPGGKREAGETIRETVRREIKEELGVDVTVGERIAVVDHAYTHFKITLHAHECRYESGEPKAIGVRAWKWVRAEELKKFAFPAANQPVIEKLLNNARQLETLEGMVCDDIRQSAPTRRIKPRRRRNVHDS
jgi:A/G-specific adenine glycosylase